MLTKAELDYLLFDNHLFNEVSRGKICFSCRKTKFNLFSWGQKCRICQQKICKKCLRSVQLKNGYLAAHMPLFRLQPAVATTHPLVSPDKYKSMRVEAADQRPADAEDFEILSMSSAASSSTIETNSTSMSKAAQAAQMFEICADCFQMMEGVVVSANESDLARRLNHSPSASPPNFKKSISEDTSK